MKTKNILMAVMLAGITCLAQIPPVPGMAKATVPLLSPRAASTQLTGKAMATPATYYFRAVYSLATNAEAITNGGAYGLYCSPSNQQANIFLGFAAEGTSHIAFTGPLPANPLNLWVTYSVGEFNMRASPVVILDTNLMVLSTNAAQPKIVSFRPQVFAAPPTNLTLTIKPSYVCITIMGSTNLATTNWYAMATTTNGFLVVKLSQTQEWYRARVDAANVTLSWAPSSSPNVTGYVAIEYDKNTNVITTLTVGNVTNATMTIHRPDKCVIFACESVVEPDMEISAPSAFAFYKPNWPTILISR
jgi:hypothetical protein